MRKNLLIFSCFIVCTFLFTISSDAEQIETDRMIIGFKENIDLSLLEEIPHEVHHTHDTINAIAVTIPVTSIKEVRNDVRVKWVELDHEVNINAQLVDWGHEATVDINTSKLHITGKGIKVGIIDTGVYVKHPDLRIKGGVSFVEGTKPGEYEDDNGHGTHVTGIIAAQNNNIGTLGVAPDAEIYAIKSLDNEGNGRHTEIIAGIEWAIGKKLDILNLSITSPYPSTALEEVIKKANQHGILLVAASGNIDEGETQFETDIMYPARYPTVIGVGSVKEDLTRSISSYTGPSLAFTAPGEKIYSTYINTGEANEEYVRMSGTSMAAPFVTGIIALYKELYPSMNPEQIKQAIASNAIDLGTKGKNHAYGHGLIQSPATMFWDVKKNSWYIEFVSYLSLQDHVIGYPDSTFRPTSSITRGEVVKMVSKALDVKEAQVETIYKDVDKDYFAADYIAAATEAGWIKGYPNNEFKPKEPIKRRDAALIIQQAFKQASSMASTFVDVKEGAYYFTAINGLNEEKIITGYPEGFYFPEREINRAEFSTVLAKALKEDFR